MKGKPVKVLLVTEFVMFVVSALLLLLLVLLLYKAELSEAAVKTGVIVIYIITGMTGGILIGKQRKERKFLWGLAAGALYFAILFAFSVGFKQETGAEPVKAVTTLVLCAASGMAGGMVS